MNGRRTGAWQPPGNRTRLTGHPRPPRGFALPATGGKAKPPWQFTCTGWMDSLRLRRRARQAAGARPSPRAAHRLVSRNRPCAPRTASARPAAGGRYTRPPGGCWPRPERRSDPNLPRPPLPLRAAGRARLRLADPARGNRPGRSPAVAIQPPGMDGAASSREAAPFPVDSGGARCRRPPMNMTAGPPERGAFAREGLHRWPSRRRSRSA